MLLQVENNLDKQPSTLSTYLSTNGTAGGTVVPVKNINGFLNQWAIQLGRTGEEQAEILTISGVPAGTALNTAGTARFPHPLDTPVYHTHYDQIIFLRSTSGTAVAPTAIATVSISPDSLYTEYNDASGAATYAYQTQFYNSVSGDVSGTSSWFLPGGPTFYSLQKIRSRVKDKLYSANFIKSDDTITDWINEWLEILTNSMIKVNQGYALGTVTYPFTATGTPTMYLGTVTDPLFKNPVKIEVTYDGVNYTNSNEIALNQFGANDNFSGNSPRHYWMGDTVFGILPGGSGGTVRMSNSVRYTPLANDSDELPQLMKSYTTSFVEYCLYVAYDLDQKTEQSEAHYGKAIGYQNAFVVEITPRDQTGPKMINFVETISGMNEGVDLGGDYVM